MEGRDGYELMGGDHRLDHVIAQPLADGKAGLFTAQSRMLMRPPYFCAYMVQTAANICSGGRLDVGGHFDLVGVYC